MKQTRRLTESDLHRIIKESVRQVLNEDFDSNGIMRHELNKNINYYYSESLNNLIKLQKEYEKLPNEYSNMKNDQISRIRLIISDLKKAFSGETWQEEGPSLSMMSRY